MKCKRAEREAARKRKEAEKEKAKLAKKKPGRHTKAPVHRRLAVDTDDLCSDSEIADSSKDHVSDLEEPSSPSPKRRHQRQLPALFRDDSDTDEDGVDFTIFNLREPINCCAEVNFWVGCSKCGT